MTERMYTLDDLIESTGFSRRTLYKYMHQGLMPKPKGASRGPGAYYTDHHLRILRELRQIKDDRRTLIELTEDFHVRFPRAYAQTKVSV